MTLLIPRRMRLPAAAAAMSAWGVALVVGVLVAGQRHADPIDRTLIQRVHETVGDGSGIASYLLVPTDTSVLAAAVVLMMALALLRRRWDVLLLTMATPALGVVVTELALKPLFGRRLYGQLSYPSGHAVAAVMVYTIAILALTSTASRWWRLLAAVFWLVMIVEIMTGLVGMNCHYPTDAVGGVCVAVGVVLPCVLGSDTLRRYLLFMRQSPRNPAPYSRACGPDAGLAIRTMKRNRTNRPGHRACG
jgi:membrane-associated phospholipid phosphatase